MKIEAIPDDMVEALLTETSGHVEPLQRVEQFGPLRQYDTATRCACRGCGSSTFYKVNGIPRCTSHALKELNLIIHQAWPDKEWLR